MTCPTGKREWPSERSANRGLRSIKNPEGGAMHSYKCTDCSSWHIGHGNQLGSTWRDKLPPIEGYGRPTDLVSGFILVGMHQVVFGTVCLSYPAPTDLRTSRSLTDLDLPEGLITEVWDVGLDYVIHTLLTATSEQLDQIKAAWASQHPTGGAA